MAPVHAADLRQVVAVFVHPGLRLRQELPGAAYVAFDLLAWGTSLLDRPFRERRAMLERHIKASAALAITPQTDDPEAAQSWLSFNARGVEGIVAKRGSFHTAQANGR